MSNNKYPSVGYYLGQQFLSKTANKWSSESGKNERPESGYKDNMTMPLCQVLKVGILELTDKLAANTGKTAQTVLMGHLKGYGAELLTECKAEKITKDTVVYTDKEGKEHTVKADSVVMAVGERPDASLYESLEGKVKELYNIGDSNGGAILPNAIYEGYTVGSQL